MRRFLFVLFAGLLLGQSIRASWAEALFSQRYRDFGTVPHGQVLTHYFTLTNNTQHTPPHCECARLVWLRDSRRGQPSS
ncbi:MAG: hypothetical protein KatS3mg105_3617 [Gemmatales bacterium]|nr:MAG: hypothetical protein KatS3mg105_3617 [Gemmatales bacterium]